MYTRVVFLVALFLYLPACRAISFVSLIMFSMHGPILVNFHFYVPLFVSHKKSTYWFRFSSCLGTLLTLYLDFRCQMCSDLTSIVLRPRYKKVILSSNFVLYAISLFTTTNYSPHL